VMPQYIRGNNMRLYIVGAAGSGKTTLANKLSKMLIIDCYHLDDIYYNNQLDNSLNTDMAIRSLLSEIIEKNNWIIEDNGTRHCFERVFDMSERIILLCPNKYIRFKRIIFRYIKQKFKLEDCNYKPTIGIIKRMIKGSSMFERENDGLKNRLSKLNNKVITLNSTREVNDFIKNIAVNIGAANIS